MKNNIEYFLFKILIVKVFIIVQTVSFYPALVMAQLQKKSNQINNFDSKIQKIESIYNSASTVSDFLKNLNLASTEETFLIEKIKSANSENSKLPSLKVTKLKYSTLLTFDKKHTLEIKKSDQSILINGQSLKVKGWKNISQTYEALETIMKKSDYSLFNLLVPQAHAIGFGGVVFWSVLIGGVLSYYSNNSELNAKTKALLARGAIKFEKEIKVMKMNCKSNTLSHLAIMDIRMENGQVIHFNTADPNSLITPIKLPESIDVMEIDADGAISTTKKSADYFENLCKNPKAVTTFNDQQEEVIKAFRDYHLDKSSSQRINSEVSPPKTKINGNQVN